MAWKLQGLPKYKIRIATLHHSFRKIKKKKKEISMFVEDRQVEK